MLVWAWHGKAWLVLPSVKHCDCGCVSKQREGWYIVLPPE